VFQLLDGQSVLALQRRDDLQREAAEQRLRHEAAAGSRPRRAVPARRPTRRSWWVVLARVAAHGPSG
jgi:hypothetical protein